MFYRRHGLGRWRRECQWQLVWCRCGNVLRRWQNWTERMLEKHNYDRSAHMIVKLSPRSLNVGDQVLVQNYVGWTLCGNQIADICGHKVETPGRCSQRKIIHVNLLKKWYPAQPDVSTACLAVLGTDSETKGEEEIPVTSGRMIYTLLVRVLR